LKKFVASDAERGEFAAESGDEGEGAVSGVNDNVFF
jgi:hypothetical protein